jgi:hypothetical protein
MWRAVHTSGVRFFFTTGTLAFASAISVVKNKQIKYN